MYWRKRLREEHYIYSGHSGTSARVVRRKKHPPAERRGTKGIGEVHARSVAWDTVANSTHLDSDSNLVHRTPPFCDVGSGAGKDPLQRHEQQIIRILAGARYGTRLRFGRSPRLRKRKRRQQQLHVVQPRDLRDMTAQWFDVPTRQADVARGWSRGIHHTATSHAIVAFMRDYGDACRAQIVLRYRKMRCIALTESVLREQQPLLPKEETFHTGKNCRHFRKRVNNALRELCFVTMLSVNVTRTIAQPHFKLKTINNKNVWKGKKKNIYIYSIWKFIIMLY